ncbi:MAG: hypothetical protein JRN39_06325 [Nitrososphaerota archaeon]|nr:hypothetical protein [Nitrososphaerota archaeon]MDG6939999.1 hypothetical protein [Nitrososphaerota archaeon]
MSELDSLKSSTDALLHEFSDRVNGMKGRGEYGVLIRRLDGGAAAKSATEFFGEGEFTAVGIDGSMDQNETLEMLLFYVNAMAYGCPFTVSASGVSFHGERIRKMDSVGASNAVPLWLEDLSSVAGRKDDVESETDYNATLTEISFSMMLMAELGAAARALDRADVRLLFLDRPVSGSFQSLSRDLRFLVRSHESALEGLHGGGLWRDLFLLGAVPLSSAPPARHGPYLLHDVVRRMLQGEGFGTASSGLPVKSAAYVKRKLQDVDREGALFEPGTDALTEEAKGFRKRLAKLAESVTSRFFEGGEYPLKHGGRWLRTRDLNVVNLILLTSLIERSARDRKLLVGVTKDTGSTDVSRSVLGMLDVPAGLRPGMRHDRIMFTILSAVNEGLFVPPWRSVSYDSCFATLVPNGEAVGGETPPLRAARKVASRERLFVKSFFQTRASEKTIFRSPVFLYDRPYSPEHDGAWCEDVRYVERGEVQTASPYLEREGSNGFDNMVLHLLSVSDHPEVFESYGHNILLYMADKAAKADVKMKKGFLLGMVNLKLTPLARHEKLFSVIRRYRDARAAFEQARSDEAARYAPD